jgi:putative hemolysin
MPEILFELSIVLLLIILNGLFAMSEIAVVSARSIRLQRMAEQGNRGAAVALELAENPNHFLTTVQVGITLVGIFAGAFGGANIADELALPIRELPLIGAYARSISLGLIIGAITFLSVVIGELVPKRIALQNAERIAALVARPMRLLSVAGAPVVRLLSVATEAVLALFRVEPATDLETSEEDIKVIVKQSAQAGMIEVAERDMVESIFRLSDQHLESMMTPRMEIVWLDANASEEQIREILAETHYTRLPVCDGDLDHVLGFVHAKDLLSNYLVNTPLKITEIIQEPLFAPESMRALRALEQFKQTGTHMVFLIDEYGGIEGLVTLIDILQAIVGDIPTLDEIGEPPIIKREDGSWLVEGLLAMNELMDYFEMRSLPGEGKYQTLGGFTIYMLGRMPVPSDYFEWDGFRFEVVDMDGKRVDKVLVTAVLDERE